MIYDRRNKNIFKKNPFFKKNVQNTRTFFFFLHIQSNPNTKKNGGCWLYYGGGFGLTFNHRGWVKRGTRKVY